MLTFCRSGLYALMMAGVGVGATIAAPPNNSDGVWITRVQNTSLGDDSVLYEYIAEAASYTNGSMILRTTYIPRFSCAPLTSIEMDSDSLLASALGSGDAAELDFFVDGTPIPFPVLIDQRETKVEIHFSAALEKRIQLRVLIDKGDRASISLENQDRIVFSLIGSTVSHKAAKKNCREHQPAASE